MSAIKAFNIACAFSFLSGATMAASFSGDFAFQWLETPGKQHRDMKLLSDVSFTDDAGKTWRVPAGAVIDGASIPPSLWSFAGSPFTGNYRRVSVIHDYYCDNGGATTDAIDEMFLEGMLADGVSTAEAYSKYGAVYLYQHTPFGTCGKLEKPLTKFEQLEPLGGIILEPKAVTGLNELKLELPGLSGNIDLALKHIDQAGDVVAKESKIEAKRTFQALLAYRFSPTEENVSELEAAVDAEKPTEPEYKQLMYLAADAIPPTLPHK
jgi:hypothetical protein